jgi:hypothetical protein
MKTTLNNGATFERIFRLLCALTLSFGLLGSDSVNAQALGNATRLSTMAGSSVGARVVSDGLNVHVSWVESYSPMNSSIMYRRSTDGGVTWRSPVQVASNVTTASPLALIGARGAAVIILWTTNYDSGGSASGGIFVARSTDTGTTFSGGASPVVTPSEVAALLATLPSFGSGGTPYLRPSSVVIDSANRVHIGFYGGPNIGQSIHKMSCDAGASWKPAALISVGDRGIDAEAPRLFEQNGTLFAAYRSSLDGAPIEGWPPFSVRVARMTPPDCAAPTSGKWLSPSQLLSDTGYANMANTYGSAVSVGASGAHLTYWNEASGGANVIYRKRAGFNAWSAEQDVTSTVSGFGPNHLEHDGAVAEYGEAKVTEGSNAKLSLVVGRNDQGTDASGQYTGRLSRLFYRLSSNGGTTWSAPLSLNSIADGFGVDSATSGNITHVVWSTTAFNTAGGTEIIYRSVDTSQLGQLVASDNPLAFPAANVGQTTTATLTLTNNTSNTLSGMTVAASGVGFTVTSTSCSTALAPASACVVTLTFTPAASGTANGSVSISGGGLAAPATVALSGSSAFDTITHYYTNILNRAPDAGGSAYWRSEATRLQSMGASPVEAYIAMAANFFASAEYVARNRSSSDFIEDLYKTFFNRASDAGGKAYWLDQMAKGFPSGNVLNAFMFSPEFTTFMNNNVGVAPMRAEIAAVIDFYRGALSRLPETSGLIYWANQLRQAQCASVATRAGLVYSTTISITSAFFDGGEYAGRSRTNSQFVSDLYNSFFRSGGETAGVAYWIGALGNASKTRSQERVDFINSPQYAGRVNAVTAEACTAPLQ